MTAPGTIGRRLALALPTLAILRPAAADPAPAFTAFLSEVRAEALAAGIRPATVDNALTGLQPNPRVLELDNRPPERLQSWTRYRATRLTDARIAAGRR